MIKRHLYASETAYIDPLDCGSTVGYRLRKGRRGVTATVDISDCNRKIEWYFSNDPDSVAKISKAIEILQNFQKQFLKACRRKKK